MINKKSHQFVWLLAVGTALSGGAAGQAINQSASESRTVIINRVRLTNEQITALEQRFQIRLQEGSFWYDKMTGAWGLEGGPGLGLGVAGLNLGGPLRADSSKGDTKVFINGRELHWFDVAVLQQLGPVYRGRYWVDALGPRFFRSLIHDADIQPVGDQRRLIRLLVKIGNQVVEIVDYEVCMGEAGHEPVTDKKSAYRNGDEQPGQKTDQDEFDKDRRKKLAKFIHRLHLERRCRP